MAFSFLCTFVPGSEKTIERTFAPVKLSFRRTFAPGSEKSKNFRSIELSMELLHPWNLRSTNNLVPFNFRSCGLLAVITATRNYDNFLINEHDDDDGSLVN